jgi:hypothetical protein
MSNPVIDTIELKRLPFARRPIAEPGTVLVFQMPDNRLVAPEPPYTMGETWWKGPKQAYVVDNRPHGAVFTCRLPAAGDAVFFDATVRFRWRVSDPITVVRERVEDPEAEGETYLAQNLPVITRRHEYHVPADVEADIARSVGGRTLQLKQRGIDIDDVHVQLRIAADRLEVFAGIKAAPHEQQLKLLQAKYEEELHAIKRQRMNEIVSRGPETLYAFILQEDPTRGMEVVAQMQAMADREKQRAIEAIKVLIDGEEIRVGELDGAVADAVNGFRNILGQYAAPPGDRKTTDPKAELSPGDDPETGRP